MPILIRDARAWVDAQLNLFQEDIRKYTEWPEKEQQYKPVAKIWEERLKLMVKTLNKIRRDLDSVLTQEVSQTAILEEVRRYREKFGKWWDDDNYTLMAYEPELDRKRYVELILKGTGVSHINVLYSQLSMLARESLEHKRDAKILEIGCGVGRTLYDLSRFPSVGVVVGIEVNFGKAFVCSKILAGDEFNFRFKKDFGSVPLSSIPPSRFKADNVQVIIADADGRLPVKEGQMGRSHCSLPSGSA